MDDNCVTIYDIKSQHFGVVLASLTVASHGGHISIYVASVPSVKFVETSTISACFVPQPKAKKVAAITGSVAASLIQVPLPR